MLIYSFIPVILLSYLFVTFIYYLSLVHFFFFFFVYSVIWLCSTQLISLYAILLRRNTWGLTLCTVSDDLYCDDMQSVILVTMWVIVDDSCINSLSCLTDICDVDLDALDVDGTVGLW